MRRIIGKRQRRRQAKKRVCEPDKNSQADRTGLRGVSALCLPRRLLANAFGVASAKAGPLPSDFPAAASSGRLLRRLRDFFTHDDPGELHYLRRRKFPVLTEGRLVRQLLVDDFG